MEYITDIENLRLENTAVTLGKFDGNHIGHQLLFEQTAALKEQGLKSVVLTFASQPKSVTGANIRTIQTNIERRSGEEIPGIDYLIEWPFDLKLMSTGPEEFVKTVLEERLGARAVVCGTDFRFGKDRAGDVNTLKELGRKYGFEVHVFEKVTYKGEEVSSTRIRAAISEGNIPDANAMLGHPFSVISTVVHGKHQGSAMGFPTINFEAPDEKILPPNGVYATKTVIDGRELLSITNVGNRPTFEDGNLRTVETNIFGFSEDVYGKSAEVRFYAFIRPERKFDAWEDLKREIDRNKEEVKRFFEKIS